MFSLPIHLNSTTILGRDPETYSLIDDPRASRHHCKISHDACGWRVTDLNSKNFTLVNGEKITDSPLKNGDILRIVDSQFKFILEQKSCVAVSKIVGEAGPPSQANSKSIEIAPRRTLFHATAFATLSFLLFTIMVTDFSWDTSTAVGAYWSHRFSRKSAPEPRRKNIVPIPQLRKNPFDSGDTLLNC